MRAHDTSPSMDRRWRALLMAKTPGERVQMGVSMHEAARTMVLASLPAGLSQAELLCALLERFYGHELSAETKAGFRQCVLQRHPPARA